MAPNIDLLGDATRRCMLALMRVEDEVCVCEFVAALKESQPAVSRNLALLRDGGWLVSRREGTWIHYRLAPLPSWAFDLLDALVNGGVPVEVLGVARSRLEQFQGRPVRFKERAA